MGSSGSAEKMVVGCVYTAFVEPTDNQQGGTGMQPADRQLTPSEGLDQAPDLASASSHLLRTEYVKGPGWQTHEVQARLKIKAEFL